MRELQFISPTDLRDFARSLGWVPLPEGEKSQTFILQNERFPRRQLIFPMDTTVSDYGEVIQLIIEKIAEMEAQPVETILAWMRSRRDSQPAAVLAPPLRPLSADERQFAEPLLLHTLHLREWLQRQAAKDSLPAEPPRRAPVEPSPEHWILTHGWQPHPWQEEARHAWFGAGHKGTMKVVTGAGKTAVSLFIAERLQREVNPDLRVAIVVPTIVLLNQWYDTLLERSNLPTSWIGRMGGGYKDNFSRGERILVAVLASARQMLPDAVRQAQVGGDLLLILDESHRAGAPEMSAVLKTEHAYTLGLSATPEREDGLDETAQAPETYADSLLGQAIGAVVYEVSVKRAVELGILPPFSLEHYGLCLTDSERLRYERLTRSIQDARAELLERSPLARKAGRGEALLQWCRRTANKGDGPLAALAARYVSETGQRKLLLYGAARRMDATLKLLSEALAGNDQTKAILFHESIEEVEKLYAALGAAGIPAVLEHSDLPASLREASLELFRTGQARVIVSARSLIEGFDVPAADLGIIVASSSSPRQRIQSIGRVLRKHPGLQKQARICILYMRDTVDDAIYLKEDWGAITGVERNHYFHWDIDVAPVPQQGPPRTAIPSEREIDLDSLRPGDLYPGRYEGEEFSCDAQGNISNDQRQIASNTQGVSAQILAVKGAAGRFKVTPQKRAILVLRPDPDNDGWRILFAGVLREPFRFDQTELQSPDQLEVSQLRPGDPYPGPQRPAEEYAYRQKGGGVIARKASRGEDYAQGPVADQLVAALRQAVQRDGPVSRFRINTLGHAFFLRDGAAYFIAAVAGAPEFPGIAGTPEKAQ